MPDPATAVLSWMMAPGVGEDLPTLEELSSRPRWMARAACRGEDLELFFPVRGVSKATMERARALCSSCPVRSECLDYARGIDGTAGLWGGTTEPERRRPVAAAG
jgi:WhiB family transcriptional regulator, redox-sensing transcriptional regulator